MDRRRENAWLRHQQERWLRPDAHRWIRPDAARFIAPGSTVADVFPALSLKYNPSQPRVPAGNSDGGQWTDGGSGSAASMGDIGFGNLSGLDDFSDLFQITPSETGFDGIQLAGDPPEGIGHNQGPPLDEPPEIPQQRPETRSERMDFVRDAVSWIRLAGRYSPIVSVFLGALDQAEDLKALTDVIRSANDPPRSLDELQDAVGSPGKDGYHDHHIAEQKAARDAGDPESVIQSRDNLVRIPILKHIDITSYYATKIKQEDGSMISPREILKDKDFEARRQFGLDTLRRYGVLK